ncbi:MAG: hypothetical protein V3V44_02905 [Anaerolineales bacterium]
MNLLKQWFDRDKQNLQLFGSLILFIPLIWWLVPGWSPGYLIDQHDNLQTGYVYQQQLSRASGDWTKLLYWPQIMGGVKAHDVTGSLPIVQLLAYWGASSLLISNLSVFFVQILFSYFCTRSALGLSRIILRNDKKIPYLAIALVGILFGFLPLLGWRLSYGHQSIVLGLFVFLCMTSLLLDEICSRRSALSLLLAILALTHCFQYNGYQLIYYSVVFGAPILVALAFANPGQNQLTRLKWFIYPALVFLSALLIGLPKFAGMLGNALSDEMGRVVGSPVIYSYTTATIGDWASSIPWSASFIPESRTSFFHQEVNYPLGPLVLLLALVKPKTPLLRIYIGLGTSLFLALVVSMNVQPLSGALTSIVPLLESFRVPARAILPFLLFLSLMSVAVLLKLIADAGPHYRLLQSSLLAIVSGALFAINTPLTNDIALVLLVGIFFILLKRKINRPEIAMVTLALFTGAAVAAFNERIVPPLENPISSTIISPIRESITTQVPELAEPLNRAFTNVQLNGIGSNSAFLMDISTLSGYWFPLSRYAQLSAALNNEPYHPTVAVFHNDPSREGYEVLNHLYNVGWSIDLVGDELQVNKLDETWGKAWFSKDIVWQNSLAELASTLRKNVENNENSMMPLLSGDPATAPVRSDDVDCRSAGIPSVNDGQPFFPLNIQVDVEGQCLLTVAMNFANNLKVVNQDGIRLQTFPSHGALLGIKVGQDSQHIIINPEPIVFPGVQMASVMGLLLSLAMLVWVLRNPYALGLTNTVPAITRSQAD